MQALVLNSSLTYCQDLPVPEIGGDEALIRLSLAGICATDLELVKGYAGFTGILGHEFVGVVEAVGQERHRPWLQRRVVGSINIGCGRCAVCLRAGQAHCPQRKVLGIRGHDGVFADYLRLPVCNLYAVPDEVADEAAVFTEPLAAAQQVVKQLAGLGHSKVAVLGPGRLGLLIAQVLALAGYEVTVLGRSVQSLVLPGRWGLQTALVDEMAESSCACVVEASGQVGGFRQALRLLAPRGVLLLKSTFSAQEPLDLSKVVVAELQIIGSRCGPFAEALQLLRQQQVAVADLLDGKYALQAGLAAFSHAGQRGVRKILLQP